MTGQWHGSDVMAGFAKIAAESGLITSDFNPDNKDFLGNPSEKTPVKDKTRYEPTEDYNNRYNKEGEKLIDKAHPKNVEVADAMGKGGLVENENQRQEKDIEVATRMPSGALFGIHADLINDLVKLANKLDDVGNYKAASLVDKTIREVRGLPFDKGHSIQKEAALFGLVALVAGLALPWIATKLKFRSPYARKSGLTGKLGWISAGVGLLNLFGSKLTSIKENLNTDLQDLYDVLEKLDTPSSKKAIMILKPHLNKFSKINLSTKEGAAQFLNNFHKLSQAYPQVEALINNIIIEYQSNWFDKLKGYVGMDVLSRFKEKYSDFKTTYKETQALVNKTLKVGGKLNRKAISLGGAASGTKPFSPKVISDKPIYRLQRILFESGFRGKKWEGKISGELDQATVTAAKELESLLNAAMSKMLKKNNKDPDFFNNSIIKDGKLVGNVNSLYKVIQIAENIS